MIAKGRGFALAVGLDVLALPAGAVTLGLTRAVDTRRVLSAAPR